MLGEQLLGQTHAVGARLCQAVADMTAERARLVLREVLSGPIWTIDMASAFPIPVRFAGREYGILLIAPTDPSSSLPAIAPNLAYQLAYFCGMVLHLLEQAALVQGFSHHLTSSVRETLTPREHEVLAALARGEHPQAIAQRLHIAPATVSKHLENLYDKLGVHCAVDAILVAHRASLIRFITADSPSAKPHCPDAR